MSSFHHWLKPASTACQLGKLSVVAAAAGRAWEASSNPPAPRVKVRRCMRMVSSAWVLVEARNPAGAALRVALLPAGAEQVHEVTLTVGVFADLGLVHRDAVSRRLA